MDKNDKVLRKVPHPKKLMVQLIDDVEHDEYSLSFSDDGVTSIDPNVFDKETNERVLKVFATAYGYFKENVGKIPMI